MHILLHSCCAPCSLLPLQNLQSEDFLVTLYWYNPNIHPYTEYQARHNCLVNYAGDNNLNLIDDDNYGLRPFLLALNNDYANRCDKCYTMRLEQAAKTAVRHNFAGFTTSLLISPYQNHRLIINIAEAMAAKYNTKFIYRDFRPLFRQSRQEAKRLELYRQKYCGCIFSEDKTAENN